jgi:hypothetical protein
LRREEVRKKGERERIKIAQSALSQRRERAEKGEKKSRGGRARERREDGHDVSCPYG